MAKTTIGGKAIKAGQRTTRGVADTAEGSSLSSTGLDRAQFGAGSGAGQLEGAIQAGNEANVAALGGVSNQLTNVNGALTDLNSNMETLKKLETATLLFEFSKFGEFGTTFGKMDEQFTSMDKKFDMMGNQFKEIGKSTATVAMQNDANFDELIATTAAASRNIIKSITRMHGMISGDSASQLKQRIDNTSGEQSESLTRSRDIRAAQRAVMKKHNVTRVTSESDEKVQNEFGEATRKAQIKSKVQESVHIRKGQEFWYKRKEQAEFNKRIQEITKKKRFGPLDSHDTGKVEYLQREKAKKKVWLDQAKEKASYRSLQIWDHGEIKQSRGGRYSKNKKARVTYSRDLDRKFEAGAAMGKGWGTGKGGGGGGMDECCDSMISLLKEIEINTHVFREVRKEFKASFVGSTSLAKRETAQETANAQRNKKYGMDNVGQSSSKDTRLATLGGARKGLGYTPYNEKFAGSNMMPNVIPMWKGSPKKQGLIKRIVGMVKKHGLKLLSFIGARAAFLLPLFSPIGAVVAAVGATLIYAYWDEINALLDEAEEYFKKLQDLQTANTENVLSQETKDADRAALIEHNAIYDPAQTPMGVDPHDKTMKPISEFYKPPVISKKFKINPSFTNKGAQTIEQQEMLEFLRKQVLEKGNNGNNGNVNIDSSKTGSDNSTSIIINKFSADKLNTNDLNTRAPAEGWITPGN
jgi:hypothetical protein